MTGHVLQVASFFFISYFSISGLDVEMKPNYIPGRGENPVALLQLCDGKTAVLIRLCSLKREFSVSGSSSKYHHGLVLPKPLVEILNSEFIKKVGVAVSAGA